MATSTIFSSIGSTLSTLAAGFKGNIIAIASTAIAWIPSEITVATEDEITDFLNAGQIFQADLAGGKPLATCLSDFKTAIVGSEATTGRQLLADAITELGTLLSTFESVLGGAPPATA
jgi:hypothetical protein